MKFAFVGLEASSGEPPKLDIRKYIYSA